ncbi:GNAT family N-acetyltransferase [Lapidilactobacillus mulanensis]|uniref:GNAT family N-acetyltransferase n=1 Tax=Lapidilactobacillus mulanensis TaxID=2485999 RepID=A0ABW4DPF1_9LACO|nr:GNAT family N-acetyltransferase [Lapidilactobacillus mulanensis]
MEKFEKYHPIMTHHYTFNWLTSARLNESTKLMQFHQQQPDLTTAKAASTINQTMLKVMRNQQLTWGIFNRADDRLLGLANLFEIDEQHSSLKIQLELLVPQSDSGINELLARLVSFAFAELDLETIYFEKSDNSAATASLLTKLGFAQQPTNDDWFLKRAVSIQNQS